MKGEIAVKIIIDACKKAKNDCKYKCPLYHNSLCSWVCNVPRFMEWLMSEELYPEDVSQVGLFAKQKTAPRGKRKR